MFIVKLLGLLLSAAAIGTDASPLARIHVKFVQPPHIQEHGITTDGERIIAQQSYISVGRRNPPINYISATPFSNIQYYPQLVSNPYYLPRRTVYIPIGQNGINYGIQDYAHQTPDYSNGLDYPDPLLLRGEAATLAVKYIYGRGELFFHEIPHVRAILRNQEERRRNGLNGNVLSSLRPESPWYRKNL
ncbi:PREDICTED: uncharacterized protein LOC105359187 [Ceratosolen solmsi marchali]|uniref:Uncharacterized protein LOC105359187 n=1 Tax=Ceratosolen solmsi marchali TaxID=326594 RepID=A0AAJ6YBK5_9HYME|nr:PREDICTED: uncharacterized protein LOC105359187 [Ceratosolen solmsi marchali]